MKKLKSLKLRRMYMPHDRLRRLRKTRLLKKELKTVPETPLCAVLSELQSKGD
ncbi:MAG: hypothetical protein NC340_06700 [Ruminococcus flavefaciens]|nr:hypothetical protein [Ruminococcus flavefaciens]MCM1229771.1 hypothetical protein [Ruminococcus flavefaciens]